jgi:hypothetical protein
MYSLFDSQYLWNKVTCSYIYIYIIFIIITIIFIYLFIYLYIYSHFIWLWPIFPFLRGISPLQGCYLHTGQHKQNKQTQMCMTQ